MAMRFTGSLMRLTPLEPWIVHKIGGAPADFNWERLEAWQLFKLNETLELAGKKSAFYRKTLAGLPFPLESLSDLRQYPTTNPADVRENPLAFVCVSQDEIRRVVTLQSSGTTGEPKRVFFTAADQELTIDFFSVGMNTLTEPGDRVLILLPCQPPGSVGDLLRTGLERSARQPVPHGPVRDPNEVLESLRTSPVDSIVGSPTQVLGLARRWVRPARPPRTVLLSTDYVPEAIVRTLEETWGCEVFNHYGSTEMGLGGGVECSAHNGYHLRDADLLFEIIDPHSGEPVSEGVYGEIVFTTLTRQGMPLIRYRMGDRSRFLKMPCPCGTVLRRLEKASGRFDGRVSVGVASMNQLDFDEALFPVPGLANFTIRLMDGPSKPLLQASVQMLSNYDAAPAIRTALQQIPGMDQCEVQVEFHYAPLETGSLRKRMIIDKRGQHA
jgi:phenylacetate-coenzyme A ligase PaaK-like adenylate-forming protein